MNGRYACFFQIAYQWPGTPGYLDQGLSWHHSICQEADFRSPWHAAFDGFCTAFDLGFVDKQNALSSVIPDNCPSPKARAAKTVGFQEEVLVQLYAAGDVEANFRIDHDVLSKWDTKPWSLSDKSATTDGHLEHCSSPLFQAHDSPTDRAEEVPAPRVPGYEWVEVGGKNFDVPPLHIQLNWIQNF